MTGQLNYTNYLSNIFQILSRLGLVASHRGAKRGYTLARSPSEINLRWQDNAENESGFIVFRHIQDESDLAEIARLLQVDSGSTWKTVLDAVRTMRPPSDT